MCLRSAERSNLAIELLVELVRLYIEVLASIEPTPARGRGHAFQAQEARTVGWSVVLRRVMARSKVEV